MLVQKNYVGLCGERLKSTSYLDEHLGVYIPHSFIVVARTPGLENRKLSSCSYITHKHAILVSAKLRQFLLMFSSTHTKKQKSKKCRVGKKIRCTFGQRSSVAAFLNLFLTSVALVLPSKLQKKKSRVERRKIMDVVFDYLVQRF